jgi:ABC-type polysaccharide transport system permease subunit
MKKDSIYDKIKEPKQSKPICSICKKKYVGFGNNAEPINDGRCCDKCNNTVIIERLKMIFSK